MEKTKDVVKEKYKKTYEASQPSDKLIETGIEGFDLQLKGGIPKGSTTLLIGKPGSGIEIFAQQFIYGGLKNNEKSWYFITRDPPDTLKNEMKNFGWNLEEYEKKGKIDIIDGYVGRFVGALPPETLNKLANKEDLKQGTNVLNKLQNYVTNLRSDVQLRGVIDSLSDFLEDNPADRVSNVVKLISSVNRASNGVTLILMTKGMHEEKIENKMKHHADCVIELNSEKRGNEIERELIIEKIRGMAYPSKVIPYSIIEKGIEVETTERVA
ncbi:signal transduction protein [archaeon SCG-AAA382B04]|nr:signal transduction protein [archaeon SCG-AAA382B04]